MQFTLNKQEQYTVFKLQEEKLDSSIAPKLKTEFFTLYQSGMVNLIFDMGNIKYVDSSGLSSILVAKRLSEQINGYLALAAVSDHVMKLMTISKLDSVLNIIPTVEESVDAIFMAELERDIKEDDSNNN